MLNSVIIYGVFEDLGIEQETFVIVSDLSYINDVKAAFKSVGRVEHLRHLNASYIRQLYTEKAFRYCIGSRAGEEKVWAVIFPMTLNYRVVDTAFTGGCRTYGMSVKFDLRGEPSATPLRKTAVPNIADSDNEVLQSFFKEKLTQCGYCA